MDFLEERIKKDGHVYPGNILKVDSFLNHQIDVSLMDQVGEAFYEKYKDRGITKILTIEASGIAIAYATARAFGVPLLFAKKNQSLNIGNDVYEATVSSFTYKKDYQVVISKKYLGPDDHVVSTSNKKSLEAPETGLFLMRCRGSGVLPRKQGLWAHCDEIAVGP